MCGKFATAWAQLSTVLYFPALPRSVPSCPALSCPALSCSSSFALPCAALSQHVLHPVSFCASKRQKNNKSSQSIYSMHTYIFSFSRLKTAPPPLSLSLCPAWHCAQTCHASYIMLTHTHTYIHTHMSVSINSGKHRTYVYVCVFIIIKAHIAWKYSPAAQSFIALHLFAAYTAISSAENVQHELLFALVESVLLP